MTIGFASDGLLVAAIDRAEGKPHVRLAQFFPFDGAAPQASLEKLAKELRALDFNFSTWIHGGQYQVVSVDAPNVPEDELRTAVRWKLKDILDFKPDDATIDVLRLPVDNPAQNRGNQVFAVAARNEVIRERQDVFADAKLNLDVIDIPEMAQRNISHCLEVEGRGLAMLSFAADGGLLTVTYKGDVYLSRRIDVALTQLLEAQPEARDAYFDRIALELQRSLDHFDRQFHFINVSKLVLAPNLVAGLADYLKSNLYMPIETLDLAKILDIEAVPALAEIGEQQRHFINLGAALRAEEDAA